MARQSNYLCRLMSFQDQLLPKISIVGDIMGPALANFDGLLSMPGGCGEQNLAKFAPNIYILDYLTATNQITKKTKEDALRYITTGYQKELRYRRGEGEYSAFGSRDRKGSGMITAFLIRLYARARRHVFVDEDEIKQSVGWLKQKQKSSGCFPVNGQVFDRSLQGGVHRELIITAYTTIALLEAGFKNTTMVSNALDCILGKLDDTILNAYATSLATYTLILADHPKGGIMLSRLKNMAISLKGGQLYWSAKSTGSGASDRGTFSSVAADVETTGYALLSYLHHKEHSEDVTKIVKWLSKQRNHRGGFSSTQDTCVALQALSEVAEIYYWGNTQMNLTISAIINNRFSQEFVITDINRLILQRSKIPRKLLPNTLTLNASGSGCAFVQVSVKYNVPAIEIPSAFDLKTSVHRRDAREEEETTSCHPLRLQIEAKWLKKDVSNMAIVDVKLVSGFIANKKSLELKLRHSKNVASCSTRSNNDETHLRRYEIDGQRVILYFNKIKAMIFSLDIIQSTVVKNAQPGVVSVYDYYDPDSQAKILYNITENDCHGRERKGCPLTPCGSHSHCTNINGSYTCQCESGYTSSNGGQSCTATECPEDWKKIDGLCFYISNDTASSWNSARDDCRERGGHLTVPTNSEMNGIVLHAIQQRNIESVWIGVYRKYERKFYEVGGDEIFYHNWDYMEPNNVGGKENCVELRNLPHFSKKGGWNDVPCNRSDLHYVCQRCL
ncbi:C3 and PZP-like alpha-2-macroglobulin domain-containing protein 8 isoform X1 [Dendronephthya gigantea]|uniref:C3 and PZP-like alpha-2-macroglobulin domain-containing protein 8 isoform X1 n=2 Tax=Dendronephthya gigantea TaxID=151771 RepID=UPI00106A95F0|nr:C3 and PZP-like alpha-2-macroglobulin domain-containing protein 8 isoform X1 [Dendronephthya gigantea]